MLAWQKLKLKAKAIKLYGRSEFNIPDLYQFQTNFLL